jgi:hypothetical protein
MVRSFICPIIRSFVQIIFFQPLCCRNSDRSFIHNTYSIVRSYDYSSFVHIYDYSPFIRSFIVTIHCSSFIHTNYSSFIVRSYNLFIVHRLFIARSYGLFIVHRIVHSHYLSFIGSFILLFIVHPIAPTAHLSCRLAHLRPTRPIFQSYGLR